MNEGGVLVIGLDGGTLDVIGPLAASGRMPVFSRLLAGGRSGPLRSTTPWYTVPGWTSLMTGVGPETHRSLYWVVADEDDYFEHARPGRRFVTSGDLRQPTFWDVAGAAGKRVAIVNMPLTYPAWPVNGQMITGLLTPHAVTTGACHPADLLERFPGYQVDMSASREGDSPEAPAVGEVDVEAYLAELIDLTHGRRRVSTSLLAGDVDLGVVVFVGPDRIAHKAWPSQTAILDRPARTGVEILIERYYRTLDETLGAMLEAAGPDVTVMVVADHGFSDPPEHAFQINGWLREQGFLRLRMATAHRAVTRTKLIRRMAGPAVRRWRRKNPSSDVAAVDWSRSVAYGVFYPHTRVCGITLNRAGIKREGIVEATAAPALLERIEQELMEIRDPTGRAVVKRVDRLRNGPKPGLPDLYVETEDPFVPGDGLLGARLLGPWEKDSGLHDPDGIFVVHGPAVRGSGPASADILDVAPTVLGMLGVTPPTSMEGRARHDLMVFPTANLPFAEVITPSGAVAEISESERDEIEAHLQALGYLE